MPTQTPRRSAADDRRSRWMLASAVLLLVGPALAGPEERAQRLLDAGELEKAASVAERYLANSPDGEQADAMRLVLEEVGYSRAVEADTLDGWRTFRRNWPEGEHAGDVVRFESRLACETMLDTSDTRGLRALQEAYPKTPCAAAALEREEDIAFAAAESTGTGAGWRRLVARYPEHPRIAEALAEEESLSLADARADGSPDSLRTFLTDHPRSTQAADVRAELFTRFVHLSTPCPGDGIPECPALPPGAKFGVTWEAPADTPVSARLVGWTEDGAVVDLDASFAALVPPNRAGEASRVAAAFVGVTGADSWTLTLTRPLKRAGKIDGYAVVVESPGLPLVTLPFRVAEAWAPVPPEGAYTYEAPRKGREYGCFLRADAAPVELPCESLEEDDAATARRLGATTWRRGGDHLFLELPDGADGSRIAVLEPGETVPRVADIDGESGGGAGRVELLSAAASAPLAVVRSGSHLVFVRGDAAVALFPETFPEADDRFEPAFDAILAPDGLTFVLLRLGSRTRIEWLDAQTFEVRRSMAAPYGIRVVAERAWRRPTPGPVFYAYQCSECDDGGEALRFFIGTGKVAGVARDELDAELQGFDPPSVTGPRGERLEVGAVHGRSELFVVEAGKARRQITEVGPIPSCEEEPGRYSADGIDARWLPGGAWIAVRVYRCANEAYAHGPLFLVSPDGRRHVQIEDDADGWGTGFGDYLFTNWSADRSNLLLRDARLLTPEGKLSAGPKGAREAAWYRPTLETWLR